MRAKYFIVTSTEAGTQSLRLPHTIATDSEAIDQAPATGWVRVMKMAADGADPETIYARDT